MYDIYWWRHLILANLVMTFPHMECKAVIIIQKKKKNLKMTFSCSLVAAGPEEWEGVYQAEAGPGQFLWRWAGHLHQLQQERQTQPVFTVRALTFPYIIVMWLIFEKQKIFLWSTNFQYVLEGDPSQSFERSSLMSKEREFGLYGNVKLVK